MSSLPRTGVDIPDINGDEDVWAPIANNAYIVLEAYHEYNPMSQLVLGSGADGSTAISFAISGGAGGIHHWQLDHETNTELSLKLDEVEKALFNSSIIHFIPNVNIDGNATIGGNLTVTGTFSATIDHGGLDGLADDDHTQYLLANGDRSATELEVTNNLWVGGSVTSTGDIIGIADLQAVNIVSTNNVVAENDLVAIDDLFVGGTVNASGIVNVDGDFFALGDAYTSTFLWNFGDMYTDGDSFVQEVQAGGDAYISGELIASGNAFIGADLEVGADIYVGNDLTVTGDILATNVVSTANLVAEGDITIADDLFVGDVIKASGKIETPYFVLEANDDSETYISAQEGQIITFNLPLKFADDFNYSSILGSYQLQVGSTAGLISEQHPATILHFKQTEMFDNLYLDGELIASGNAFIDDDLEVGSDIYAGGNITATGTLEAGTWSQTLTEHTDVNIAGLASGHYLTYDGSEWVNAGAGGGGDTTNNYNFLSYQKVKYNAADFEAPVNSDYAVNALAPLSTDSNNAALLVRKFDDTTVEGVAGYIHVPEGIDEIKFKLISRAETTPGGVVGVVPVLHTRQLNDGAAIGSWSDGFEFNAIALPASENWIYSEQTVSLANLEVDADETFQFELVRSGADASDDLSGDWTLLSMEYEFLTATGQPITWWYSADFENPDSSDWKVNALAPAAADSNNAALMIRLFDDTTVEGVGGYYDVPAGTASLKFHFITRAESTPGGSVSAVPVLHTRQINNGASIGGWSDGYEFAALDYGTNENWVYDTETIAITGLNVDASETFQFELVRSGADASDDLSGDWTLLALGVEPV